jgi:hypothetical protein
MCTVRNSRALMSLDSLRVDAPTAGLLALAGLAAVNLAVLVCSGPSAQLAVLTALFSMALAGGALFVADRVGTENAQLREHTASYDNMLNEYFLVSTADATGRFCDANDNLLQRSGYTLEELGSQPLGGLSAGIYTKEYLAHMWETVQSGRTGR